MSVVLPTYNEKDSIAEVIRGFEALGVVDEIIVVNNNAAPGTSEEVAGTSAREVVETRQGYGAAIRRGLREAERDLICVCEPDGTFDPEDLRKLLTYTPESDFVVGSRTVSTFIWDGANMGWFLQFGQLGGGQDDRGAPSTRRRCQRRRLHVPGDDPRDLAAHPRAEFQHTGSAFGLEMLLLATRRHVRVVQIPVNYLPRVGESSVTGDFRKTLSSGLPDDRHGRSRPRQPRPAVAGAVSPLDVGGPGSWLGPERRHMTVDHGATVVTREPDVAEERAVEADDRTPRGRRFRDSTRHRLALAGQAAVVGIAGCVLAAVVVGWDPRQWRVYFSYEGDTFFNAINGVEATPLGVTNVSTHLGWPYGMNLIDFPAGEPLFTWFQWFFHLFVNDQFTVLAALWFLGFFGVGSGDLPRHAWPRTGAVAGGRQRPGLRLRSLPPVARVRAHQPRPVHGRTPGPHGAALADDRAARPAPA